MMSHFATRRGGTLRATTAWSWRQGRNMTGAVTVAVSTLVAVAAWSAHPEQEPVADGDNQQSLHPDTDPSTQTTTKMVRHHQQHQQHNPLLLSSPDFSWLPSSSPAMQVHFFALERTQCDGWLGFLTGGGRRNDNKSISTSSSGQPTSTATSRCNLRNMVEKGDLEARYDVNWQHPIGEGTFGLVYKAVDRVTGEPVALKEIPQTAENDETFQREIDTLLYVRQNGGHSNICQLRANYERNDMAYLVLDYIQGGEMFDHLANHGPYSEADAARLIREVASALAFLHGLNVVHGDLKPENLMLSSEKSSSGVIKLVDFGSAVIKDEASPFHHGDKVFSMTPGYSPPEYIGGEEKKSRPLDPTFDMWALAVITYIMLTGAHPFDFYGDATDEDINKNILKGRPPIKGSRFTSHLSWHAVDLLEKLFEWEPEKRMTAFQLLENPWVQGKTARQQKMTNSDKRLKAFKKFQTKIGAKLFAGMVGGNESDGVEYRTSLIERAFRELDPENKGYVTTKDMIRATGDVDKADDGGKHRLSLSGFSDLLADSMKNRYFDKGEVIYREGDKGNCMYFIDSGTVIVETVTGSVASRGRGDFFGEGALLHPQNLRSATIKCKTPVHAMEISREYFEKYMKDSDEKLFMELTEKDKIRKRNRSKMILRAQNNLKKRKFKKGQTLFKAGDDTNSIYLVEDGKVDITVDGRNVFSATNGNLCGEYSSIMGRPRNASAVCESKTCEVYEMSGKEFLALLDLYPDIKSSLQDLCLRRNFKKAVVHRLRKEFPYEDPREAFNAVKTDKSVKDLTIKEISTLMLDLNPDYTDAEIKRIVGAIKLTKSDRMSFDEFKKVFIADIKTSASI